jgi:S1-C subfamily serine protease
MLRALALAAVVFALSVPGARAEKEINSKDIFRAVVGITASVPEDARSAVTLGTVRSGSGIVIDDKGLVLTIGYLILEAHAAAVTDGTGELVPANLVAYDQNTGFGLLRATKPLGIKPVALGSSDMLPEGAPVLVISHGGPAPVFPVQVVARREFAGYWEYLLDNAIFTAPAHPQFGGAALIGVDGRLVGVGSLIVNDAVKPGEPGPGNMFVPIDALKPILKDLVKNGRARDPTHPWLGVYTEENGGRLFVSRVAAGSPAEKAGIRKGDVIMGVGGHRVSGMADFLRKVWATGPAGVEVPLDLLPLSGGEMQIRPVKVRSLDRYDWLKLSKGL